MSTRTAIQLITRGDDLGAFHAGNQAIIDASKHGILRNASIMMPAPHAHEAIDLLDQVPNLCLGLHVTLTSEWNTPRWGPVSPAEQVPTLVDEDGYFFHTTLELFEHGVKMEEMVQEAQAQLQLARQLRVPLSYIDEHMGIGWLFDHSQQYRLAHALRELAAREGLHWWEDGIQGYLHATTVEDLQQELQRLTPGTYVLITHPAYESEELVPLLDPFHPQPGAVARARSNDYLLLSHPAILETIQLSGISLVSYAQIRDWTVIS